MTFTIPTIYKAIDQFTSPVKGMKATHQSFSGSLESGIARGERAFRRFTPALGEAGRQMLSFAKSAAIAAAIIGTITFSFQSLRDYETALASTQAVTGTSNDEFKAFRAEINEVARDTRKSAVDTAKSFELIGSAKPELLASADALGEVTKATIILSKASRDDLETSALNLTGVMNQFNLAADQSNRTINVLSAGAKVGSASISNVGESMKNFGSVAAGANMSLEESVALVEVLGKFSVFGAEAGTKLRGSILKLQQAGVGYQSGQFEINDALAEAKKRIDALSTAKQKDAAILKMFGAENISTGKILLNNISLFEEYTKGVTGTDTAHEMAAINTDTFSNVLDEASNTWVNMITASSDANSALNVAKDTIKFLTDNMSLIVSVGTKILLFFAAWKAILLAAKVALVAYNVVLGVTGAISGTASVAIGTNAVALGAYKIALALATAAQWALNVAMTANPIGLIIVGIAALIGLVTVVIKKWNDWGAALSLLMGPIGLIISMVQSFRRNWDMITKAFKEGGIVAGLKAIGVTIIDAILMPIQQVLSLAAKIPGMKWAQDAANGIQDFRNRIGANTTTDEEGNPIAPTDKPAINPKASEQEALSKRIEERTQNQNVKIDIKDETGRARMTSDNDVVPINLTSTAGF